MTVVDETADSTSTGTAERVPAAAPGGLLTPGEVAALFRVDPRR